MPRGIYQRTEKFKKECSERNIRLGIVPPFRKGKSHTKETKKKISQKLLGYIRPLETRKKMSEATKGEKNKNWKGGITSLRFQIYNLYEFRLWRLKVYTRDNYTCVACHKVGGKLNAHHIKSFSKILEENNITSVVEAQLCGELWDVSNGVTLCKDCHKLTNSFGFHK